MTTAHPPAEPGNDRAHFSFDRHTPEYRTQFVAITEQMHATCPIAWSDTYDGH